MNELFNKWLDEQAPKIAYDVTINLAEMHLRDIPENIGVLTADLIKVIRKYKEKAGFTKEEMLDFAQFCDESESIADEVFRKHTDFVNKTFGGHGGIDSFVSKLEEEVQELAINPYDIMELADVLLVLLSATNSAGYTLNELHQAALRKIEINQNRKWELQPDGTYKHIQINQ